MYLQYELFYSSYNSRFKKSLPDMHLKDMYNIAKRVLKESISLSGKKPIMPCE